MIDWGQTAAHATWMAGAAIVLAALSYHQWRAGELKRPRWSFLDETSWRRSWAGGMCLFAAGWMGASGGWRSLAFGALTLVFAASFVRRFDRRRRG